MQDYEIIIDILLAVLSGRNLNEVFNESITGVDGINVSKIKDISYGVLRNFYFLNGVIDRLVNKRPSVEVIRIILLVAIYEVTYTKKPAHAITNDIVELGFKFTQNQQTKGFLNAVIRNYIRGKDELVEALKNNQVVKYNFPKWWIAKLTKDYPKQYQQILTGLNFIPKMNLRVNPRVVSQDKYIKLLNDVEIKFILVDNKISLLQTVVVNKLPLFNEGGVSIQDINAQKLLEVLKLKTGDYVLDACSAPGGKICQMLENYDAEILALDIDQKRLDRVQENLDRLNLKANLIAADASSNTWWDGREFNAIIADVPCSASGTVKRNPDIKLNRKPDDINNFVTTQRKIIENLWSMLKPAGTMIYITCSIFKEENEDNISYFKESLPSIKIIESFSLMPTEYTDGFFYCVLKKVVD